MKFVALSSFLTFGALALVASNATFAAAANAPSSIIATPRIAGARDLGRLPVATPVHLAIGLKLRNAAELDALIAAQSNPRSPMYRHFLTAAQAQAAFSATATDYARARIALRAAGFSILQTSPSRGIIDVVAPSATVERYFSTQLHAVSQSGRQRTAYTNIVPAAVPPEIATVVSTVAGLNGTVYYHAAHVAVSPAAGHVPSPSPTPTGVTPIMGPDGGYGPPAITGAFDFPSRHGFFGNGATVADLMDGTFDDSLDIAPYLAYFGTTRTGPKSTIELINGGCGVQPQCVDTLSAVQDAEGIIGTAPGIAYRLYDIPSLSNVDIIDGLNAIVTDNRADIVNLSYIACESNIGEAILIEEDLLKLGTAQGMTFEAVSTAGVTYAGPVSGSDICQSGQPTIGSPADSPNVLAVGGADLFVNSSGSVTRPSIGNVASGGGVSFFFDKPTYQSGIKGLISGGRNTPDIAGPDAINATGSSVYYAFDGGWKTVSGVNNAPIAGGLAELAQIRGQRLGLVNPALYAGFATFGYSGGLIRDVTLGCNGIGGNGPFCAGRGYDHVSGIGVPDFYKVARKI